MFLWKFVTRLTLRRQLCANLGPEIKMACKLASGFTADLLQQLFLAQVRCTLWLWTQKQRSDHSPHCRPADRGYKAPKVERGEAKCPLGASFYLICRFRVLW